jgi:hypothetical protein
MVVEIFKERLLREKIDGIISILNHQHHVYQGAEQGCSSRYITSVCDDDEQMARSSAHKEIEVNHTASVILHPLIMDSKYPSMA